MLGEKIVRRDSGPMAVWTGEVSSTAEGFFGRLRLQDFIQGNRLHPESLGNSAIGYLAVDYVDAGPDARV